MRSLKIPSDLHPGISSSLEWRKTSLGNAISLFHSMRSKTRTSLQKEKPILMIGGVHGDEPEGIQLSLSVLAWIQYLYQQGKESMIRDWYLVPCLNVDGYSYSQRTNSNGVDINRNFKTPNWSNKVKVPRYFPGLFPESEVETQIISELIQEIDPHIILHFHSWYPSITFTGPDSLDEAIWLSEASGYPLQSDIGYPTPGSLGEYGWLVHRIPVICIEIEEKIEVDLIWPLFLKGFEKILFNEKDSGIEREATKLAGGSEKR